MAPIFHGNATWYPIPAESFDRPHFVPLTFVSVPHDFPMLEHLDGSAHPLPGAWPQQNLLAHDPFHPTPWNAVFNRQGYGPPINVPDSNIPLAWDVPTQGLAMGGVVYLPNNVGPNNVHGASGYESLNNQYAGVPYEILRSSRRRRPRQPRRTRAPGIAAQNGHPVPKKKKKIIPWEQLKAHLRHLYLTLEHTQEEVTFEMGVVYAVIFA